MAAAGRVGRGAFAGFCGVLLGDELAEGARARLEAFASENGPRFYGLPLNEGTVTLERGETKVPDEIAGLVPFHAGEMLRWRLTG